ncbi:MAG: tRNA pseudouridine(65) synthase TruC [Bdellovibrio sp.]|nr:tRNA pseudouridine(65) synthase TruC [Bdellovibrio sp.]
MLDETIDSSAVPEILFQDESILVLFKPSKWFVHPPEEPRHRRGLKRKTCVQWLMDFHQIKANPIHRIDVGTEGVLIFAKTKAAAQNLNLQFKNHTVLKTYHAVTRGWFKDSTGVIDLPLELDSTKELVDCRTNYKTLARLEKDFSIHPKFLTSRYSLLEVKPETGRWHQIRRHMNRISHPLIGDSEHGDLRHNRYFREALRIDGLCLRATEITFIHPETFKDVTYQAPKSDKWKDLEIIFQCSI